MDECLFTLLTYFDTTILYISTMKEILCTFKSVYQSAGLRVKDIDDTVNGSRGNQFTIRALLEKKIKGTIIFNVQERKTDRIYHRQTERKTRRQAE